MLNSPLSPAPYTNAMPANHPACPKCGSRLTWASRQGTKFESCTACGHTANPSPTDYPAYAAPEGQWANPDDLERGARPEMPHDAPAAAAIDLAGHMEGQGMGEFAAAEFWAMAQLLVADSDLMVDFMELVGLAAKARR